MSARDEALDLLEKMLPREHAKAYRELFSKRFDAYAHELAEKQRAHITALITEHGIGYSDEGWFGAADLIDPHLSCWTGCGCVCHTADPSPCDDCSGEDADG